MGFAFRSLLVSLPALRVICECKLVVIIYLQMKHMCAFPKEFKLVFFLVPMVMINCVKTL